MIQFVGTTQRKSSPLRHALIGINNTKMAQNVKQILPFEWESQPHKSSVKVLCVLRIDRIVLYTIAYEIVVLYSMLSFYFLNEVIRFRLRLNLNFRFQKKKCRTGIQVLSTPRVLDALQDDIILFTIRRTQSRYVQLVKSTSDRS